MRKYLTILFTCALISAMLLPSVISLVTEYGVEICDFSEEETEEHKEKEFEKEKITYHSSENSISNSIFDEKGLHMDIFKYYNVEMPDIHLPPPEVL